MKNSSPLLRNKGQTEWNMPKTYTIVGLSVIGVFLTISNFFAMSPKYSRVILPQETFALMQGVAARNTSPAWVKKGLGKTLGFAEGYENSNTVTAAVERPKRSQSSTFALEQENIPKQHAADLSKV